MERRIELHNNGEIVEPAWELQKSGVSKAFPYLATAAGAGIGYFSKFDYDGESYSGGKSALMMGIGGLVGSVLLQEVLLPSSRRRSYVSSERQEWMESLNRQNRPHFLAVKQYNNNNLLVVPQRSYRAFAQRARAYKDRGMPIEGRDPGKLMAKKNGSSLAEKLLLGTVLFGILSSGDSDSSCHACNGKGSVYSAGMVVNCGTCQGTGKN